MPYRATPELFLQIVLKPRSKLPMSDLGKVHFNAEEGTMMIGGLSTFTSTATVFNPVLAPANTPAAAAGATAKAAAAPAVSSPSAQAPAQTSVRAASQPGGQGGGAAASAAAAAASIALVEMMSAYSMTVKGKQYAGGVEETSGEYTASVPQVAGAVATASTEQVAENNLNTRVDELV